MRTPYIDKKPSSLRYYQEGPPESHDSINMNEWALKVFLSHEAEPILIAFDDLKNIKPITESRRVVCVCNWSIRRNWTGVLLEDLLGYLGINVTKYRSRNLRQVSLGTNKEIYDSTISLNNALENRAMIVWAVDGEHLTLEEGYPIRLIDFSLYRYKGVKCLSELYFTDEFELGFWEKKAGYSKEGKIKAKRYRIVDLQEHRFINGTGEVTDF
ncbi:molybdopterin-dependent oxidoreductase [Xenorhabdus szentirmaii]|uniref:Sulfite-dehydrogenase n=1 Tax=Xenorhabdus szentirmaii DSM 16338 TaxID=1427518 RepID=W1J4F1_9GAMM|nr:molybdopterin-dependent oxidoreductase [Xenorhabdus szentirmaii]PHM35549.1 transmembrane protein [Xenorhabdus szentirmaii DSM 16338]CDL84913.1 Sulfite-dehydrogenase [Xenorhabdus szentirmaii DSM 16338]